MRETGKSGGVLKWFLVGWTVLCLLLLLLFLTVITLDGAPLDEWLFFALMAVLPWILLSIARAVK